MVEPKRAPPGALFCDGRGSRGLPLKGEIGRFAHILLTRPATNRPHTRSTTCGVVAARRLVGAGAGDEARSMRRSLTLTGLLFLFVFGLAHAGKAKAATVSAKAARIVKIALRQRGIPYHW